LNHRGAEAQRKTHREEEELEMVEATHFDSGIDPQITQIHADSEICVNL
jgi:hypothetical protein